MAHVCKLFSQYISVNMGIIHDDRLICVQLTSQCSRKNVPYLHGLISTQFSATNDSDRSLNRILSKIYYFLHTIGNQSTTVCVAPFLNHPQFNSINPARSECVESLSFWGSQRQLRHIRHHYSIASAPLNSTSGNMKAAIPRTQDDTTHNNIPHRLGMTMMKIPNKGIGIYWLGGAILCL